MVDIILVAVGIIVHTYSRNGFWI